MTTFATATLNNPQFNFVTSFINLCNIRASTIATHARPELRPNFQILFYPVITMDKSYTHIGSHDNLLGKDASAELETEFSNEKQVTKETPRAFIAYSDDDKTVPPANGVNYYREILYWSVLQFRQSSSICDH